MFSFGNTILLGAIGTSGLMKDALIGAKGLESGLDKFKGIVCAEDFWVGSVLGFDFSKETGKCGKYLSSVMEKIDPTDSGVVVHKDNVVEVAAGGRSPRWAPDIAMDEVEGSRGGGFIARGVGGPMVFA